MKKKTALFCLVSVGLLVASCKRHDAAPEVAASGSAAPAPSAPVIKPEDIPELERAPTAWPVPQGPRFAILAGEGIGPIRFGATTQTVERLMEAPCETKDEASCRYPARGVEFLLTDGVVSEIRTHRPGRPRTAAGQTFGIFNGKTPEGVMGMMLKSGVVELLGPPLGVEEVKDGGVAHTVETDRYDGLRIEYDVLPSGKVGVGGIIVVPHAKKAGKAAAAKPAPSAKRP